MASLLESFYVLFESNADEVKRGEEEAARSGDKLEQSLGEVDRAAVKMGEEIIHTLKGVAVGMLAAFGVDAIKENIVELAEMQDQLVKTADRLEMNVGDLDAWQQAAIRSGGSAQGMNQSLESLNRGLTQAGELGMGRLKPVLDELGLKAKDATGKIKPLTQIMLELSDKFKAMGSQKASGYGSLLGLDPGTMLLLMQGREGVKDLVGEMKSLGVMNEEDAHTAEKFNDQLANVKQQMRNVYISIGSAVLPVLTKFFHGIQEIFSYLGRHKGLVTGFFIAAGIAALTVYTPAMIGAAAATWAALAPILAIVIPLAALGAAFALAYEDIQNFLEGNQSVTGELAKRWPIVGDVIRNVASFIGQAMDEARAVAEAVGEAFRGAWALIVAGARLTRAVLAPVFEYIAGGIAGLLPKFQTFSSALKAIFQPIIWLFKNLGAGLSWLAGKANAAANTINHKTAGVDFEKAGETASRRAVQTVKSVSSVVPQASRAIDRTLSDARKSYSAAATSSFNAAPGTVHNSSTRTVQLKIDTVTVQTQATDSDGISRSIGSSLSDQLRQAMDHLDDGVRT